MLLVVALYASFLLTALLVLVFMKIGLRLGMVDNPNPRKVHNKPIPRTGGPAIIIGTLLPLIFLLANDRVILGICLGTICLLLMGIADDIWDLNYKWKFLGQIIAAAVTLLVSGIRLHTLGELWPGHVVELGILSLPLSMFFLVATTNMVNLNDGLDGLAGGMCFLIFSGVGFLAYFQKDFRTVAICICGVGAIAGFLRYNTHPATVFMGDSGSHFLGFLAGAATILLTQADGSIYSPIILIYILGIPAIDLIVVVFQRLLARRHVFRASNDHLHHKLLKLGFQHTETVMLIYAMQLVMILLAWASRFANDLLLFSAYLCLLGVLLAFSYLGRRTPQSALVNGMDKGAIEAELQGSHRKTVGRMTFYGLVLTLSLFYLVPPLMLDSVPKAIGLLSLTMLGLFLIFNRTGTSYIKFFLMLSIYLIGIYYIAVAEYGVSTQYLNVLDTLLIIAGVFYVGYLVTSSEKTELSTSSCLLLALVIFTFFLPTAYLDGNHLHMVAAKAFMIFLFIDLLFSKYKTGSALTLGPAFLALTLTSIVAFL